MCRICASKPGRGCNANRTLLCQVRLDMHLEHTSSSTAWVFDKDKQAFMFDCL